MLLCMLSDIFDTFMHLLAFVYVLIYLLEGNDSLGFADCLFDSRPPFVVVSVLEIVVVPNDLIDVVIDSSLIYNNSFALLKQFALSFFNDLEVWFKASCDVLMQTLFRSRAHCLLNVTRRVRQQSLFY